VAESDLLDNVYFEFDSIPLNGRQIINLSNNINMNVLVRNATEEQLREMLSSYSTMSVRRTVYPAKIIVLIALTLAYRKFFMGRDILDDVSKDVNEIFEKIKFDYISDKYDMVFLSEWVQWYLCYLLENHRLFLEGFGDHCYYLFEYAYSYYNKINIDRPPTSELSSGLYVPLAFVMTDMKFNPYKFIPKSRKYNYISPSAGKYVCEALFPIVNLVSLIDSYIKSSDRSELFVEDLRSLSRDDIISALKDKKKIVTKNPVSDVDLFPLEVIAVE